MVQLFIIEQTKVTNRILKKNDIFLCDFGQYKYGTTDITRTISLENSQTKLKIFSRMF